MISEWLNNVKSKSPVRELKERKEYGNKRKKHCNAI